MRLKTFHAPNMSVAMARVREELGPDALILVSRTVEDGVEVTAAAEDPPERKPPDQLWAQSADLAWHGVPSALAAELAADELTAALGRALRWGELPLAAGLPPLLIVGPPGAGKTTTTARLATRLTRNGQASHVITTDGRRPGAAEHLAAFTRILGLTLIVADAPHQLPKALARCDATLPTLIDTPGLDPAVKADRTFLRECRALTGGAVALVLPAGLDPAEAEDLARGFMDLGASFLIANRLDHSRRLGGILAATACGLTLTDAGIGPGVADGMAALTPSLVADRLASPKPAPRQGGNESEKPCPIPSPLALLVQSTSHNRSSPA